MGDYDQVQVVAYECHNQHMYELPRQKLISERGIYLGKLSEKLLAFHDILMATRKRYFSHDPSQANGQWVRDFYANLSMVSFSDQVIRI